MMLVNPLCDPSLMCARCCDDDRHQRLIAKRQKQGIDIFERRVIEAEEVGDIEGATEVSACVYTRTRLCPTLLTAVSPQHRQETFWSASKPAKTTCTSTILGPATYSRCVHDGDERSFVRLFTPICASFLLQLLDQDGDAIIQKREMVHNFNSNGRPYREGKFEAIDTDSDNVVTWEEFPGSAMLALPLPLSLPVSIVDDFL